MNYWNTADKENLCYKNLDEKSFNTKNMAIAHHVNMNLSVTR